MFVGCLMSLHKDWQARAGDFGDIRPQGNQKLSLFETRKKNVPFGRKELVVRLQTRANEACGLSWMQYRALHASDLLFIYIKCDEANC